MIHTLLLWIFGGIAVFSSLALIIIVMEILGIQKPEEGKQKSSWADFFIILLLMVALPASIASWAYNKKNGTSLITHLPTEKSDLQTITNAGNNQIILNDVILETNKELRAFFSIENCKRSFMGTMVNCIMSYSNSTGKLSSHSFIAVAYDKDGVRLSATSFPETDILPNEKVKSYLFFYENSFSYNVARVMILPNMN